MRRILFAGTTILALLLWPAAGHLRASGPTYTIQDLGTFNGNVPNVTGINASGQVSGWFSGPDGDRAVRYTDGSGWSLVPGLESLTSYAMGINDHGDMVGYAVLATGELRGWHYTDGPGLEFIGPLPGGSYTFAFGINNNGDVVGYANTSSGLVGYRRAPGLDPQVLPTLGGSFAGACGINDNGQVTGFSATTSGVQHAFREDDGGTPADIPGLAGAASMSTSCAIDGNGLVAGQASLADGSMHAFVWNGGSPVNVDTFGAASSSALAAANGVVAGEFSLPDGTQHGFRYSAADGSVDLNSVLPSGSGWELNAASAVNAAGDLAGNGLLNGVTAAWKLSAAPPPDTVPPTITSLAATPSTIDLPNGAVVPVSVSVTATDNVDPSPACAIADVSATGASAGDAGITGPFSATVRAVGGAVYALTVRCSDAAGNHADGTVTVTVLRDTQAPVIGAVSVNPSELRPNKHRVDVTVSVSATDNVDAQPSCAVTSIAATSGSPDDAVITGPLTATVLAQQGPYGSSRVYTLNVTCGDAAGNTSTAQTFVTVKGIDALLSTAAHRLTWRGWTYRRH